MFCWDKHLNTFFFKLILYKEGRYILTSQCFVLYGAILYIHYYIFVIFSFLLYISCIHEIQSFEGLAFLIVYVIYIVDICENE